MYVYIFNIYIYIYLLITMMCLKYLVINLGNKVGEVIFFLLNEFLI